MKKIAAKGSTEKFILDHIGYRKNDCLIWPFRLNKLGYGYAVIRGKQKTASRWMCIMAHGAPLSSKPFSAHKCGNPSCVNPNHLRWATPKENSSDRIFHGTQIYGERSGKTKLTKDDVIEIKLSRPNLAILAKKYGVSKGCIAKIRCGQRWPHIKII